MYLQQGQPIEVPFRGGVVLIHPKGPAYSAMKNVEPAGAAGSRSMPKSRRLKRGVFRSLKELTDAIHSFIADTNANPKPFIWTKDPGKTIAAVKRGHQALDSIH
jgi:hypothetical protein